MKQILWGRRAWCWGVTSQSVHTRAWDERYCLQDERLLHCPPWLHRCLRGHVSHSQSRHQEMQTKCTDIAWQFFILFILYYNIFYIFVYLTLSDKARKVFTSTFVDNIKLLYAANFASENERLEAFKHFVAEFGTHYASITELGTKLSVERRYSAKERAKSTMGEMEECNTLVGSKIFGFQAEMGRYNCSKDNLLSKGTTNCPGRGLSPPLFQTPMLMDWTGQSSPLWGAT